MTNHRLKTKPGPFQAVWTGEKTFEVRLNDRFYQRGDTVVLCEFDDGTPCECAERQHAGDCAKYSGREIAARVGFVIANMPGRGSTRGFNAGDYVVFALLDPRNSGRVTSPSGADVALYDGDIVKVSVPAPVRDAMARMAAAPRVQP